MDMESGLIGMICFLNESKNTRPHSWGFLFVGGWVDLDMINHIMQPSYNKNDGY